ncbi:BA75_04179T0 [Komagataella pastoris]|uniref:BA75_04179T0 n=1 Tax=Komagataella pastoris TaxID=4922 RepID=A0A1B2JFJ8_PICPA|nr:BA75_04179T0 [Komagataella pastoris]
MATPNTGYSSTIEGSPLTNEQEEQPTLEEEDLAVLTDSEAEVGEFVRKYGDINFKYIRKPKGSVWFIRPHALNFFKDGVLYRTKEERTSGKTELFLDLMYVGIIANLAGAACEEATIGALLKYALLFIPAWVVWSDIKDFTNYYYNEDLSQKLYILWILVLLTLFANSNGELLDGPKGAAFTIVPYILCRLSLAFSLWFYSYFIPQHRVQMRIYADTIFFTSALWVPVIFVSTKSKIILAVVIIILEQLLFCICYHPATKRALKLRMSTALNIEHEVERFGVFVTIAIGEFLYKVVAEGPLGAGFSSKFVRGILLLLTAYDLFWIYQNGSTSTKATHALRRNGWTAISWIYFHLPLVGGLVLAADAGGDIAASDLASFPEQLWSASEDEEKKLFVLSLFFTGGLCVVLICIAVLGMLDLPHDPPEMHIVSRFWRVVWRIPAGILIFLLSFAGLDYTVLMGAVTGVLTALLIYESIVLTPRENLGYLCEN